MHISLKRLICPATLIALVPFAGGQASKRPIAPPGKLSSGHNMLIARGGETATVLPDFKVFLAGGKDKHGRVTATTEIYDPNSDSFSAGRRMSVPREGHVAAALGDGKILIAGGATTGGMALAACEDYDFETGKFTARGNMHVARYRPAAVVLRDGRLLVMGGQNGSLAVDSAETYDLLTGKWSLVGKMSLPRIGMTATMLADGRVLVAGGKNGKTVLKSAEVFDPKTNKFSRAGEMQEARWTHAAALLTNGKVLIAGGAGAADSKSALSSAEIYDPATQKFESTGKLAEPRIKMAEASVLLDGRVLIVGGAATAEVYEVRNGTFLTVTGALDPLSYPADIQLMDGTVRIFGGYDSSGAGVTKSWTYRP